MSDEPIRYSILDRRPVQAPRRSRLPERRPDPDRPPTTPWRYTEGAIREELHNAQGQRCYLCGDPFSRQKGRRTQPSIDHVVPRAQQGGHENNRLMAHQDCNEKKANREPYPCELLYLFAINLKIGRMRDARSHKAGADSP